jgi:predicted KAP-like P-loop ATPase
MKATKKYTEEEINSVLELVVATNNLDILPKEIAKQFTMEDCLVYIPLTEEILKNLNEEVISTIKSIDKCKELWYNKKESGADEAELDLIWYDADEQLKANEYYHWNLSGYSQALHKPFSDYVARQELIKQEQNSFFGGVANNADNGSFQYAETDLSWLNNL